MIAAYVTRSFDDPARAYVWVRLLVAARPELSVAQARFAVHAALALVVDLGRLVAYDNSEESRAVVRRMMEVTVLGQHAAAPLS